MASACVNNIGVPPDNFIDCAPAAFPTYGWLSPRISRGCEYDYDHSALFAAAAAKPRPTAAEKKPSTASEESDPSKDAAGFEFRLEDPVAMHPADELFSDGKLVPLQLTAIRPACAVPEASQEAAKSLQRSEVEHLSGGEPYLFSPKAPTCTSRWKEILGLKKLRQNSNKANSSSNAAPSASSSAAATSSNAGKSMRQLLLRNSKSLSKPGSDPSLNIPLLKYSDCESVSVSSSRLSLSASSSGHDFDDLPRLSLDSDTKNSQPHIRLPRCSSGSDHGMAHPRLRMVKPRMVPASIAENPKPLIDHPSAPRTVNRACRGSVRPAQQDLPPVTSDADSPRMSSSGKIVFQSLERSSSSPSSFNGGPRYKHRGMERSYSANVRVTPVLNVPVCSLRRASKSGVLGLFSSQSQKKEGKSSTGNKAHQPHHHRRTGKARRDSR